MEKSSKPKFGIAIVVAVVFLLSLVYFGTVVGLCIYGNTHDNPTLKTIGEWMLLVPMLIIVVGEIAAGSLMVADTIANSKRKEPNKMQPHTPQYPISERKRERNAGIYHITIHCECAFTLEGISRWIENMCSYTSYNYLIDRDGRVMQQIPPEYGSWSTGSKRNDVTSVNILCATDTDSGEMPQRTWDELVELCIRICRNNGKNKLLWRTYGDYYNVPLGAMTITLHHLVNSKHKPHPCVTEPVISRLGELATTVTEELKNNIDKGR